MLSKLAFYAGHLAIWCLLCGVVYWAWLDRNVVAAFNARRWDVPTRIYAAPLEIYRGAEIEPNTLAQALRWLGYRETAAADASGQFTPRANGLRVSTRGFAFADGAELPRTIDIEFAIGRIASLTDAGSGTGVSVLRLEPLEIGRMHAASFEDRVLLTRAELPEAFVRALLAIEDRRFHAHIGVDWFAIIRALWVNILRGGIAQGGSTLTQQLVKNLYLGQQQTVARKFNEALMAISIERSFGKDEILETYANEVFLGQEGSRAIHGFGLASRYYFGRPLGELSTPELALLVGLVRGPSRYNPFKHPERALARRATVLDVFAESGLITPAAARGYKRSPLGLRLGAWNSEVRYGAFLDLVKRQLKRDYRQSDLRTAGLKVFTTLDIVVQSAAEVATRRTLEALEKERPRQQGSLQASTIVVDARTADIRAMVGGRDHRGGEFNRALDAHRQIGSLIKPFIYLTALERLPEFNVASRLSDRPGSWPAGDGRTWTPGNYDGKYFGDIAAETALARSLNLATVRLGFQVGIESVRETLKRLGVEGVIPHFPSLFLGALELTPYEVTQLYQVFANDGFRIPLRAIHAVVDSDNEPIRRYGLKVEPVVNAADAFLVRYLLTRVVDGGTARRVASTFPHGLPLAGKTGTTNDARDSWFAGFTGNDLVTTWIGRDDNQPIGLTGASGALRVWLDLVGRLGAVPVEMDLPPEVEWHWLTPDGSALVPAGCLGALRVPVNVNHLPSGSMPCGQRGIDAPLDHAEPRW